MALIFLKTVTLTGRARRAPPEDRDSTHVGNLDCQIISGGDLILSPRLRYLRESCAAWLCLIRRFFRPVTSTGARSSVAPSPLDAPAPCVPAATAPSSSIPVPNPGAPVPPLVPSAKKARRLRILLYTGPYYKEFDVPATSTGRSARLFLVIQKKKSLSLCKTRKRKPTAI